MMYGNICCPCQPHYLYNLSLWPQPENWIPEDILAQKWDLNTTASQWCWYLKWNISDGHTTYEAFPLVTSSNLLSFSLQSCHARWTFPWLQGTGEGSHSSQPLSPIQYGTQGWPTSMAEHCWAVPAVAMAAGTFWWPGSLLHCSSSVNTCHFRCRTCCQSVGWDGEGKTLCSLCSLVVGTLSRVLQELTMPLVLSQCLWALISQNHRNIRLKGISWLIKAVLRSRWHPYCFWYSRPYML